MTARNDTDVLFGEVESLLDAMIEQQRAKVLRTAVRLRPNVTGDDVLDPHSIPELAGNAAFAYEDGILAGLVSAKAAIARERAERR